MDRTSDLQLATYLVANGYVLRTIEGAPGRRIFVFDRDIASDIVVRFHGSEAKRLLDVHRSLKVALATT
jgi:hypothetical protein